MEVAIIGVAGMFFLGHALQWFFIKTKIPDLLILTIMGYIAGPIMHWVAPEDLGQVGALVATVALIVILYEAGLHLSTSELKEAWLPSLTLSLLTFFSIGVITFLISSTVVPFPQSILVAFGVGSTSSAIVIPMVKFLSLEKRTKTILSLESAFTDIFAIIFFLVALEAILQGFLDIKSILFNLGPATAFSMGFGVMAGFAWAVVKRYAPEYTYMKFAGEAWALLSYGLANLLHLNGAMSVLCLGFTLANLNLMPRAVLRFCSADPVTFEEMSLLKEITFILKTFFFLYLGTLISLQNGFLVFIGFLITIAIYGTRYLSALLLFKPGRYPLLDALTVVAMGPRGLACAVLATIPLSKGLPGGETIQQIVFAVITMSIFLTAVFVFLCENANTRKKLRIIFPMHKETLEISEQV